MAVSFLMCCAIEPKYIHAILPTSFIQLLTSPVEGKQSLQDKIYGTMHSLQFLTY